MQINFDFASSNPKFVVGHIFRWIGNVWRCVLGTNSCLYFVEQSVVKKYSMKFNNRNLRRKAVYSRIRLCDIPHVYCTRAYIHGAHSGLSTFALRAHLCRSASLHHHHKKINCAATWSLCSLGLCALRSHFRSFCSFFWNSVCRFDITFVALCLNFIKIEWVMTSL